MVAHAHNSGSLMLQLAGELEEQGSPPMQKITPAKFAPGLVSTMRWALDTAADQMATPSPTPATKAKMAARIVRSAAEGVTDAQELVAVALEEAREPAL